jgi:hypothetical protein
MHRRAAGPTLLLAAAVGLGACADGGRRANPAEGDAAGGGARATTTLPHTVTGAVDLRRLVVDTAPAGYDLLPSPPYGAVDLPRLLADFSDAPSDDQVILHDAGFARGFTRGWLRESPRSFLGVFVFEFAAEEGARTAGERFAAQNASKKQATPFAVESIAGAAGQSYTQQAADGVAERVHVITFVRGSRLYQVGGQFPDGSATVDQTVAFAEAEARLAQ